MSLRLNATESPKWFTNAVVADPASVPLTVLREPDPPLKLHRRSVSVRAEGPVPNFGAALKRLFKAPGPGMVGALIGALGVVWVPNVSAHQSGQIGHVWATESTMTEGSGPILSSADRTQDLAWYLTTFGLPLAGFAGYRALCPKAPFRPFPRSTGSGGTGEATPPLAGKPRPILTNDEPVLHQPAAKVEVWDEQIDHLLADMVATLKQRGAGLAAPQIGVSLRVALIGTEFPLVNPVIIEREGSQRCAEGCLSRPNFSQRMERSQRVVVASMEPDGSTRTDTFEGFWAVVAQHELDHLDGKTIWRAEGQI